MKIINGKFIPEFHPQMIVNARAFLERVQVNGVAEAKELSRSADLLEALAAGHYKIVEAGHENAESQPRDLLADAG